MFYINLTSFLIIVALIDLTPVISRGVVVYREEKFVKVYFLLYMCPKLIAKMFIAKFLTHNNSVD